ncbi:MAG: C4-type zinc ribbon domain-containing protein [Dehalococcoidales bacterium]|nr:C4-type zinc ribbon domain-containing protein [Dehalococcoidales bacterium]
MRQALYNKTKMSLTRQLYQLQEIDQEIDSNEQAIKRIIGQLGESDSILAVRRKLAREKERLEETNRQQHSVEWEIDDLAVKVKASEDELYSGRIRNPKELTNLQHEIDILKTRRNQLEDKALEVMGEVELITGNLSSLDGDLRGLEAEWRNQQQQLSARLEQHQATLSDLKRKRQLLADGIDPTMVEMYQEVRKQKGQAVAKVEQGVCRGCRISLPVNEIQRVRSGQLVRCSSCGRILFLA